MYDFIIAHPYKHHVYNLASGCAQRTRNLILITPFYRRGLGKLLTLLPGTVGRKASGYYDAALANVEIKSPNWLQVFKLITLSTDPYKIEKLFDLYVAFLIKFGLLRGRVFVSLQDYMPISVRVAKSVGMLIWSDQISNESDSAHLRIIAHSKLAGNVQPKFFIQTNNNNILKHSDVVTVPSRYCLDGLSGRLARDALVKMIPYGAADNLFTAQRQVRVKDDFIIVARANTVRKGGHLLMEALTLLNNDLNQKTIHKTIKVFVVGKFDTTIANIYNEKHFDERIQISAKNYPHADIPKLLACADIFVMPALSESMSLLCVEAMRAGLPIIATEYVGVDAFHDHVNGYLISDNSESLYNALTLAINDVKKLEAFSKSAIISSRDLTWLNYRESVAKLSGVVLDMYANLQLKKF